VLPDYRRKSYGTMLVNHPLAYIRENGVKMISIGIIDTHSVLKDWNVKFGFAEVSKKTYDRLPFTVCFMEKRI
jgi:diamine N-acetyltransferase